MALFFLEAIIWYGFVSSLGHASLTSSRGLPFSYGVFLDYYSTIAFPSQSDQALLPLIGTLSSGIMSISGVVVIPAAERYPRWRSEVQIIGLILCMTSFLGAAFATRPIHLVLTQGVMFSLGGGWSSVPNAVLLLTVTPTAVLYFPAVKLLPQVCDLGYLARTVLMNMLDRSGSTGGLVLYVPSLPHIYPG